jgi:deferrochelatase/peroxidase EfeB
MSSVSHPQPGVINPMPEHLILAAVDFADRTPYGARAALDGLVGLVSKELTSDLDDPNPSEGKDRPSAETGELGFVDGYERGELTITLGISAAGFDVLGVADEQRPADLRPIPWDKLGELPRNPASGDLLLQICSDDLYVCEHVVRRVEEELGDQLWVAWTQVGAQRYGSHHGRTSRREGRALIGFLDGTANLSPRKNQDHAKLVLVDPDTVTTYPPNPQPEPGGDQGAGPTYPDDLAPVPTREPAWTRGGSYMTVRVSVFDTASWDEFSQDEQERAVGRFKVSGASLDLRDDPALLDTPPAYADDQHNLTVPLTAHARKANPRRSPEDELRRLYRHGFPIIGPAEGGLRRGLAFIAFARTISTQFEFIFRAQLRNPDFPEPGAGPDQLLFGTLSDTVLCGGYYFVPPLEERTEPWTWRLPDTTS